MLDRSEPYHDLDDNAELIRALTHAETVLARFKSMLDWANDAIIGETLDGIITYWNAAAGALYGYSAEEILGKSVAEIMPPDAFRAHPKMLARVTEGVSIAPHETVALRKNGTRVPVMLAIAPILDAEGRPVGASLTARDITEHKQSERQLRHYALHDALTGLPNRVYFNERVASALDRQRGDASFRFAVLFLDFDDFKVVNDSMGHGAGDRLLAEIATRLGACVRPGDLVARLGGDEFTLLLEDVVTQADVEQATHRLRTCLSAPFAIGGRDVTVTASVGVALGDPSYERPEDLLRDADIAMYHAKSRGHSRHRTFDIEMRRWAHARFKMVTDLRRAIERSEFKLVYQPIVDLRTGRTDGFEALLRWHHPERGLIQPGAFIPLAEQTGLIVPIGKWVLTEACRQAAQWQRESSGGSPVRMSVNLSAKQLQHPHIVGEVRGAIAAANIPPQSLRLEITETVLLENGNVPAETLEALRRLKTELHVDDFGTGYSSLSYLPRFPLQAIKVDRSFVNRMGARRTDLEIVRSIVALASTLGLNVIAEGVETAVQRDRLIALGCAFGQGFFFARPLEPIEAGATIAAASADES